MNSVIYTITQNKTNKTVYATDNYKNYIDFVIKHFPVNSYEYNKELECLHLNSKNYTFSMLLMNKDYVLE